MPATTTGSIAADNATLTIFVGEAYHPIFPLPTLLELRESLCGTEAEETELVTAELYHADCS